MDENFNDRGKVIWHNFLLILMVSYIIWYMTGGPDRWDRKFKQILEEKKGLPVFSEGPLE